MLEVNEQYHVNYYCFVTFIVITFCKNSVFDVFEIRWAMEIKNKLVLNNCYDRNMHGFPSFLVVPMEDKKLNAQKKVQYKRDTKNFSWDEFILDYLNID